MEGSPRGSIATFNKTAWMTKELFIILLKHFVNIIRPEISGHILLLLDGHCSHMSVETREFDVANIDILVFPHHTTHKLQPLDIRFMCPLKTRLNRELKVEMENKECAG